MDSDGIKACVSWGAHWRHLANTTEPSMCGGDAAFFSDYFDHLFRNRIVYYPAYFIVTIIIVVDCALHRYWSVVQSVQCRAICLYSVNPHCVIY